MTALETLQPTIHNTRKASHELVAATIETSLPKLSLLHARARQTLYGHSTTPSNPKLTMSRALASAHEKLVRDERRLVEEEEAALDRQLDEYERAVRMVDGPVGGFVQVVDDWTNVQKETEECRKDLRRLGWTGH